MRNLFFCILCGVAMPLFSQSLKYQSVVLSDTLTDHADAIIRSDQMRVHIKSINEMEIKRERVVTVLNRRGNSLIQAFVGYDNGRKIKGIEATIYDALGLEIQTAKKRDFKDVSAVPGGTLYSDARVMYLDIIPRSYPYTVKFSYEIESSNTAPIPSWYCIENYRLSVEESSYEITFSNPTLKPAIKEVNMHGYEPFRKEGPNMLSYSISDLPAIQEESYSTPFKTFVPHIKFRPVRFSYEGLEGEINTWQDLGKWVYDNLLEEAGQLPETTIRKVRQRVAGIDDPLEKARIVYEYVQENTRYISVQVGIGGLRPSNAEDVDKLKYGDCKGLTNYTIALLKAVGVPAYYVHVYAGDPKLDFESDFADLSQGNHVILAIPNGDESFVWADCTSQTIPFGFLGDFTDDRVAHIITKDGGRLFRTPTYESSDNVQSTEAQITIDLQGNLKGEAQIETSGLQYDARYSISTLDPKDREVYYRKRWDHLSDLNLQTISFENHKAGVQFTEKVAFSASSFAKKAGKRIFLTPNVINRITHVPDRYDNRKLPFEIRMGYLDKDSYEIQIPEGYRPEALPAPKKIETEFGSYKSEVRYEEGQHALVYSREIEIRGGKYPKERYEAYRKFRTEISKAENAQAVFIETSNH